MDCGNIKVTLSQVEDDAFFSSYDDSSSNHQHDIQNKGTIKNVDCSGNSNLGYLSNHIFISSFEEDPLSVEGQEIQNFLLNHPGQVLVELRSVIKRTVTDETYRDILSQDLPFITNLIRTIEHIWVSSWDTFEYINTSRTMTMMDSGQSTFVPMYEKYLIDWGTILRFFNLIKNLTPFNQKNILNVIHERQTFIRMVRKLPELLIAKFIALKVRKL